MINGMAIRAPVPVGSVAEVVFLTLKNTSREEVNAIFQEESESERYREVITVSDEPLVSSDIVKDPHAAVINLDLTQVVADDLARIVSWYDNEWGYANQMIREAMRLALAEEFHRDGK